MDITSAFKEDTRLDDRILTVKCMEVLEPLQDPEFRRKRMWQSLGREFIKDHSAQGDNDKGKAVSSKGVPSGKTSSSSSTSIFGNWTASSPKKGPDPNSSEDDDDKLYEKEKDTRKR